MAKLSVVISAKIDGLVKGLKDAQKSLKKFGGFAKNVTKGLFAFGAVAIGLVAKIGLMGGRLAKTQIAMEAFLGSAEKAKQLIKDLRAFADVTPFDTNSIIEAGKALASVEKDTSKILPLIKMLGDISAGSGKDLNELTKIFVKIKNLGRLTFEELNQLANANILSFEKLAKTFGKNKTQFRKFVEAGKLGFKDIVPILKKMTQEGGKFFNLMEKQSKTLPGRISTLQGKFQNLATDIGGPLQDSLISITDTFIDWIDQAKGMRGPLGLLIKDLKFIANILESTRADGGPFLGVEDNLSGFKTNFADTIADALADSTIKIGGFEANPLAAVGRIGQAFGLGAEAKGQIVLEGIKEELERLNTNVKGGIN